MSRKLNLYLAERDPIGAAELLADKQAVAMVMVESQAGAARARFITVAPGKSMVYDRKVKEAEAFAEIADPKSEDYPLLAAEAEARKIPLSDMAELVVSKQTEWAEVAGLIEALTVTAKAAIDAAGNEAQIRAAVAGIAWPKPV